MRKKKIIIKIDKKSNNILYSNDKNLINKKIYHIFPHIFNYIKELIYEHQHYIAFEKPLYFNNKEKYIKEIYFVKNKNNIAILATF